MGMTSKIAGAGRDRGMYTWAAVGAALLVLIGFARTYYLKGLFGGQALSTLVHVHGAVMTVWVLLFITQVRLVAARRVDIHRRLGLFGAVWAGLMVVIGFVTAVVAARNGVSPGPPPLVFLAIPLFDIAIFGLLVATGIWFRKRADIHRRLMLLSCLGLLPAAIARIPLGFIATGGPLVFFGLTDLCILACVVYDSVRNRRLHPAFGWGTVLIIGSQVVRLMMMGTAAWMTFATWLVS